MDSLPSKPSVFLLKEIAEHELSMLSDNLVYFIIHGSAVLAIFVIFCSFYYWIENQTVYISD